MAVEEVTEVEYGAREHPLLHWLAPVVAGGAVWAARQAIDRGYAPWDKPWKPRIMHFHSFFVYEGDPISGMPIALAGNPGRPLLQTWQFEAFRTPDRSIWYRIRPKLDWLERVVSTDDDSLPPGPPPLTAELHERE